MFYILNIGGDIPCRYSMSTIWAFDNMENNHSLYRGEYCIKKFCISLGEHAPDVINFEKKKMLLLTSHQQNVKSLGKNFQKNLLKIKIIENTEKYKTFSVPIVKKIRKVDKGGNEDITTVSYKIKLIDSARFIASSLSNLVDNLAEGIHKIKCYNCFLEDESVNGSLIKYNSQ